MGDVSGPSERSPRFLSREAHAEGVTNMPVFNAVWGGSR